MKLHQLLTACGLTLALAGMSLAAGKSRWVTGSDTMVNLAQAWAEAFQQKTGVPVSVRGGGSGTGIAALINGTVDIANASRELKTEEREAAKKNSGKDPVEHLVAYDGLAVYLHKDNPIQSLSKQQLGCI